MLNEDTLAALGYTKASLENWPGVQTRCSISLVVVQSSGETREHQGVLLDAGGYTYNDKVELDASWLEASPYGGYERHSLSTFEGESELFFKVLSSASTVEEIRDETFVKLEGLQLNHADEEAVKHLIEAALKAAEELGSRNAIDWESSSLYC
ncbi:hypothetical protein FDI24_gp248 [Acidovorax phage ACP17]|uniref:Uncharacterized protein n=1 Tax=Acidovorax phage ACP17 TaxID=2010329 RepID=A0A218M3B9_9CAUD|nr:hypothetical protein FDI24_gp248 [Acidovorax phage ACP17]ASD50529.1 hypothetical protein [Acidovorax phage ACP17]